MTSESFTTAPWLIITNQMLPPPKQLLVLSISLITVFSMPSQTWALGQEQPVLCCTIFQKENISLGQEILLPLGNTLEN